MIRFDHSREPCQNVKAGAPVKTVGGKWGEYHQPALPAPQDRLCQPCGVSLPYQRMGRKRVYCHRCVAERNRTRSRLALRADLTPVQIDAILAREDAKKKAARWAA